MKTPARQSISKTLVKACAAAVLLVTCINAQATNSMVQDLSETFRAETMHSIEVEQNANNVIAPSVEVFEAAMDRAKTSISFRNETLASLQVNNIDYTAPSLNILNTALEDLDTNNERVFKAEVFNAADTSSLIESFWANNVQPQITSFDTLEFETSEIAKQEATVLAIDFAIKALETAKTNFIKEDGFSL